jgi:RNA polymerase-binding transcription factor DksA
MSSVKKVAEKVVEAVTPSKPLVPQKAVIVPSKPAINPKPVPVVKKPEVAKSNKPVVIPKTSTNNKVDYNPEFKSVLDKPAQQPSGPTMRYSDAELQEFRELINKKLDAAKKELAYLQGLITRKDEMGGDETDNRYMTMEDGSMSMEREQLSQMASRQITFIDHLEKAVMRIENKTYGICRVSGKLIDKARLRAVPHATLSMEAKLGIVK